MDLLFLLTTKPKYSSFFSIWSKDFKNVIFEIGWPSPFRGRWGRTFEIVSNQKNKGGLFQQLSKISSKIIFLLLWPRGRPFDLTDLRRGWVDFCENYIFEIRRIHWEKWAIACLCRKLHLKVNFLLCLLAASRPYNQKVTLIWSLRQRHAIAHFSQCIFLISKMYFSQKFTQPLLRSVRTNGRPRGRKGKKMIFELIFESYWNKPPLVFWFETISNVRPQRPRKGLGQPISKITFLKS